MSTSPIRQVFETAAPNDLVNIQRPTAGGFTAIDASVPLASLLANIPGATSGNWTPVVSGETYSEIVNIQGANYSRVGSIVTCSLFINVDLDAAETQANFQFSLPVASDFTNAKNAFGIVAFNGDITEFLSWGISANVATNKIQIEIAALTAAFSFQSLYVMLQYEVK
jgi:hypothetical protein